MIGSGAKTANAQYELRQQQKRHNEKILAAKTTVNNVWSTREQGKLNASRSNTKRKQASVSRCDEIEKENSRLLLRFFEIGEQKPQIQGRNTATDAKRGPIAPVRKQEIQRINNENAKLLKRIQGAKPCINRASQLEEHKKNQKIMHLRCEYAPESAKPKGASLSRTTTVEDDDSPLALVDGSVLPRILVDVPALAGEDNASNSARSREYEASPPSEDGFEFSPPSPLFDEEDPLGLGTELTQEQDESLAEEQDENQTDGAGDELNYDDCLVYGNGPEL